MRPRWRWWLFCIALDVFWTIGHRRGWKWPGDLMAWCVLPEWVGGPIEHPASGDEPF